MILMDTHIWLRWLLPDDPLPQNLIELIETADALAVSAISCWSGSAGLSYLCPLTNG